MINFQKLSVVFVFLIAACGGGGGGGGDSAITPPTGGGGSSGGGSGSASPVVISFSSSASELEIGSSATLSWSAANADQCEASGSWSGAKGASGSETFAFDAVGNYSFTLNCSNSSLSSTATVEVEAYRTISGTVLDGYIRGSEVFVDANNNTQKDSNETSVESDQNGRFEGLRITEGSVISLGGIDANTNLPLDQFWLTTSTNTDGIILSPVTTIATQLGSIETAKSSLGIADSIDILTFDPLQTLNDANAKHLYEVGAKLGVFSLTLKNFFNSSQGLTNSTATYSNLLAESLATRFDSVQSGIAVDDPTFIAAVVDNIVTSNNYNTSSTALTHLKSGLEALYFIEHKNDAAVDLGIQNFMLSTLQNDVQAMAQETISSTTVEAYTSALAAYIATDQNLTTADIDIPITANADSVQAIEDENAQNLDVFSNDKFRRSQPISLEFNTVTSNLGIIQANNTGADGIKHTSSPTNGGGTNTNPYINGISYSPKSNFCGEDSFEYTLIQGSQQSTSQVSVTVACVNDSPTLSSSAFSFTGSASIGYFANVGANDVDGDALSYSVGGTDAEFISVDGNGDLSFISSVSYSNPSDSNGDNVYEFTVTVSDGSTSVSENYSVEALPGANAPVFQGTTSDPSFKENNPITIQINAKDDDGDAMTLAINNPSGFSITSNANGFEITNTSGLAAGLYNVQGEITDSNNLNTTFSFELLINAVGWVQAGNDIDGLAQGDSSGTGVDIDSTGNYIAIGSPNANSNTGSVRVFEVSSSMQSGQTIYQWNQKGDVIIPIQDEFNVQLFGRSVDISTNLSLAIGTPYYKNASGLVRVFSWSGVDWQQVGSDIVGENEGDHSADSIALSDDGLTLIVGEKSYGNNIGRVRVYKYNLATSVWDLLGSPIEGEANNDFFGVGVDVNSNGTRIVVGANANDSCGLNAGKVTVYQLNSSDQWQQLGDIQEDCFISANDMLGWEVSINGAGDVVAAAAPEGTPKGELSGYVRIYHYANNEWSMSFINGDKSFDQQSSDGRYIDLSEDGNRIIIGASGNDTNGDMAGNTKVYDFNSSGNNWTLVGNEILGEATKDRSGYAVGISGNGNRIIIGALWNDGDTGINTDIRGHARVFNYVE